MAGSLLLPVSVDVGDLPADVLLESVVNAKGDLLVANAADTVVRLPVGSDGQILEALASDGEGIVWVGHKEVIVVAVGDEITPISADTSLVTFRMPFAMTVTAVRGSLSIAGSTGTTVDINDGGTTILSTKLTFDSAEKTTTTAATPAVISDAALADDAEITIDIDAAGTDAAGLKVYIIGTRT